jgi:microcystin-dependent protein
MALEAATYVNDLVVVNPPATDKRKQGDDHLRLLKSVLKATFPSYTRPLYLPTTTSVASDTTVGDTLDGATLFVDTSGGAVTLTLPVPSYMAWNLTVVKSTSDVNPVYIVPPAGTINGFAKLRLNVPFMEYRVVWTGTTFVRKKSSGEQEAGTLIDFPGATVPVGYEAAVGQSLIRADCPELFVAWGTTYGAADGTHFTAPDLRGKTTAALDSGAGLLTGGTLAAVLGEQTHLLSSAEMPAHTHTATSVVTDPTHAHGVTDPGHVHVERQGSSSNQSAIAAGQAPFDTNVNVNTGSSVTGVTVNAASSGVTVGTTNANTGDGGAHNNVQPTLVVNKMFRLC